MQKHMHSSDTHTHTHTHSRLFTHLPAHQHFVQEVGAKRSRTSIFRHEDEAYNLLYGDVSRLSKEESRMLMATTLLFDPDNRWVGFMCGWAVLAQALRTASDGGGGRGCRRQRDSSGSSRDFAVAARNGAVDWRVNTTWWGCLGVAQPTPNGKKRKKNLTTHLLA